MTAPLPTTSPVDVALRQAVAHHQAGRLQEAERLYRAILQAQPGHPDANHNLGVLAGQIGQHGAGLTHLKAALDSNPNQSQYWLSYIDALIQTGQIAAARRVLELGRQQGLQGEVVEALAASLSQAKHATPDRLPELEGAIAHIEAGCYKQAALVLQSWLVSHSQDARAYALLTQALSLDKQDEPAWAALNKALSIDPALPIVQRNHARLLLKQQRIGEALQAAQAAYQGDGQNPENILVLAVAFAANNQSDQSLQLVANTLQRRPNYAEAFATRALLKLRSGDAAGALADTENALTLKPHLQHLWGLLASLRHQFKNLPGAMVALEKALVYDPDNVGHLMNLAEFKLQADSLEAAIVLLEKVAVIAPNNVGAWVNLGAAFQKAQRIPEAKAAYVKALAIAPEQAEAACNLGVLAKGEEDWEAAVHYFTHALALKPEYAEVHNNLGATLKDLGRLDEAESIYRRALEIKPDYAEAHNSLGSVLRDLCRLGEAAASYRRAHQLGLYGARIQEAIMLPAIMGTRQEMLECRAKYERSVDELLAEAVTIDNPLHSVGVTSFYLAYHGLNDRSLQVKLAKYYEHACPSLLYTATHCGQQKSVSRKRLQVGFFSKFLHTHSVSSCYSKVVEAVSLSDDFELALISNRPIEEKLYPEFAGKHVSVPNNLDTARQMIAALKLDVLVYLDIGMEPLGYFLAFARLAPIQCVLSGHPVTTGISNMDYYLSDALLEPDGAEEHYSEKLVRLSNTLFDFERPILPTKLKDRQELDLPEALHIFMCPMKLQKLHPDFDVAITRILQIDKSGVVVLFEDHGASSWKQRLMQRFEKTIPIELHERIIFQPWLREQSDFISAIAGADVVLDPFHFGIGSTAIMVFAAGTPLVTKPGEFLRGRVGMGLCKMLDLPECIADDTESYARKAVEIARDQSLRERIRAKILGNNAALYENQKSADDLMDFFRATAVANADNSRECSAEQVRR